MACTPSIRIQHSHFTPAAHDQDEPQSSAARTVLLCVLLRLGDSPLAVQTLLSAYTAAALRVARHARQQQQQQQQQGQQVQDEEMPHACGDGPAAARAVLPEQPACGLTAAMQVAQEAMGEAGSLAADARMLSAACSVLRLQQCTPEMDLSSSSGSGSGGWLWPDGVVEPGHSSGWLPGRSAATPINELRAYWFGAGTALSEERSSWLQR